MYASASVVVDHTVQECRDAITLGPERWFPRLLSRLGDRSDKHLAAVGFKVSGLPIRKHVEVTVGTPIVSGDWVTIPISWRPTFPASLFPALDGRVKLVPDFDGQTRLTVSGTYDPPFDSIGRTLDGAVLHSAAEATLRELALSIAKILNRTLAAA